MKQYRKLIWIIFLVQLVIIGIVIGTAKVDDMAVTNGKVHSLNTGWILVREDGSQSSIKKLPHNTNSQKNEKVILKNTIPQEYWGETITFLLYRKLRFFRGKKETYVHRTYVR